MNQSKKSIPKWVMVLQLLTVCMLAMGLWSSYSFYRGEETRKTLNRQASSALKNRLPSLAKAHFETLQEKVMDPSKLAPGLVYEGKTSTILHGSNVEDHVDQLKQPRFTYHVLARTKEGRYFSVRYKVFLYYAHECMLDTANCALSGEFEALSKNKAMTQFFHSKDFSPEAFKGMFGEDPPAPTRFVTG